MKTRAGYVSNSSSSSFILDNPKDIKYFVDIFPVCSNKIYSTDDIKTVVKNFILDYVTHYNFDEIDKNLDTDAVWDKYFDGKVPEYFRSAYIDYCIQNMNFENMVYLLRELPNDKWLTDAYDRDDCCFNIPSRIETFDVDL